MSSEEHSDRLLKAGGSDIERKLLASAVDDEMPEEKFQALIKYGAGAAMVSAAGPTEPTWKLSLAKGLGLLALTAASVGAFHYVSSKPEPSSAPIRDSRGASGTTTASSRVEAESSKAHSAASIPVVSLHELPSAPSVVASAAIAAPARSAEKPSAPDDLSFTEQMKLIDSARTRLRQDDPRGALAVLDEYDRRFSAPAFKEEATVLRVSSLAKAGDRAQAKRIGEAFLNAHPSELYSRRVEAIVRALSEQEQTP
ncbi:MAG: hypothetical protein K0S65_2150 [Labilithrix sp.]|nr:hypothetical protein [Labilithrix sp.]